jgi:hypothetical protein
MKSRLHPLSVAAGLITAGLAALIVASWVLSKDFADVGPSPWWTQALTIGIAVGTVAVFALRNRPVKPLALWLAVAGIAVVALGVVGFIAQYGTGFPGRQTVLAAVGGLAVAVGAVVLSLVPAAKWRLPSVASGVFGLVALLIVPALAWPLATVTPDWRLVATTASTGEPAAVPESVSKVAWSAEVDGEIKEVVAGGLGALVMFPDGVAGVDGRTGEVRWSRRRAGAEAEQIDVSPDGRTVMLQISPADRLPVRREVLDAITGELRFVRDGASTSWAAKGFYTPMTNASYIGAKEDRSEFYGYSLIDGQRLWTFPMPAGCRTLSGNSDQFAQGNGMLLPLQCDKTQFRYVSVDGTTGQPRWQHTVTFPREFSDRDFSLDRTPDRKLARIWLEGSAEPIFVIDTETGTVVSRATDLAPRSFGLGTAGEPKKQTLVDVRSGRAVVSGGAALNCALDAGAGLLSGGALCVDQAAKPFDKIMTGVMEFATVRFGEDKLTPLPVPLGGPFEEGKGGSNAYVVTPGQGAVFIYSQFMPADGVKHRLVGLN